MNTITSVKNPLVKEVKSLKIKKYRESKGLFFIEGFRFVEEAIKGQEEIEKIFISEQFVRTKNPDTESLLEQIRLQKYETVLLSDRVFKEVSDTNNPQGILAVLRVKKRSLNEIISTDNFFILLDSIQDPGNMGTIIRTADAAAFTGVIVSKGCVDVYNPKVLRSTMGSIFHIPVVLSESLPDTINYLKTKGIKVYAAHLNGKVNYFETRMESDTAILIGNEANGLSNEISSCATSMVKIPMPGKSESLNASVAAAILMYECVRQRFKGR